MIILALLVVLFFSISSISAQSVNDSDDLDEKILKSCSLSKNATDKNISIKAKANSTKKNFNSVSAATINAAAHFNTQFLKFPCFSKQRISDLVIIIAKKILVYPLTPASTPNIPPKTSC